MHLTLSTPLYGPQLLDDCHSISPYPHVGASSQLRRLTLVQPFGAHRAVRVGATPPYAISIPHSNPFAANSYINDGRWPVTCQTCFDARCSYGCSCKCECECGFMRTREYPVYCRDYGASLPRLMISVRDWTCKLRQSV